MNSLGNKGLGDEMSRVILYCGIVSFFYKFF